MTMHIAPLVRRVCLLLALVSRIAEAHPIHTTLSVLTPGPTATILVIRAFADDFSAAVARFAGKHPAADSTASDTDIARYLAAHISVTDAAGRPIVGQLAALRRADGLYWATLRFAAPSGGRGTLLQNRVLSELHDDQVNVVQVEGGAGRRTMLFTRDSRAARIVE